MFISLENSSEKSTVQNFKITNNIKIYIIFFFLMKKMKRKTLTLELLGNKKILELKITS